MTTLRNNNVLKNRTPKTVSDQEIGYSIDIQADTIKNMEQTEAPHVRRSTRRLTLKIYKKLIRTMH